MKEEPRLPEPLEPKSPEEAASLPMAEFFRVTESGVDVAVVEGLGIWPTRFKDSVARPSALSLRDAVRIDKERFLELARKR